MIFHNFKNNPCYIKSEVSLKRFYFALFDLFIYLFISNIYTG